MTNGFLNDLPELDLPARRKKKKSPGPGAPGPGAPGPGAPKSEDEVVRYVRLQCKKCKGFNVPVYDSGHLPIRYHKCTDCGHTFKSVEE